LDFDIHIIRDQQFEDIIAGNIAIFQAITINRSWVGRKQEKVNDGYVHAATGGDHQQFK
jgi:hypothetical protein